MNYSLQVLIFIAAFAVITNAQGYGEDGGNWHQQCDEPPSDYVCPTPTDCYKFHVQNLDWLLARVTCREEGGDLAVLNSEAEAKFVTTLWNSTSGHAYAYIGIHDRHQENVYITIYNQTLEEAGYSKWYPTEPNGGVVENCGLIHMNGLLADIACIVQVAFICEINCQ